MALLKVRPGDVIVRDGERLAVLSVAHRGPNRMRVHAIGTKGRSVSIDAKDFTEPPDRVGEVAMPVPFNPNNRSFQQEVVRQLQKLPVGRSGDGAGAGPARPRPRRTTRWPAARTGPPTCGPLGRWSGSSGSWPTSTAGSARAPVRWPVGSTRSSGCSRRGASCGTGRSPIGASCSSAPTTRATCLLAEAVARGLFDDLDPPAVAALVSCVTYEHRSRIPPPPPWFPSADVRGRFEQLERIGRDLQAAERKAELPETRLPDPTFAALAHAWASGTDLATVLDDEDLSGGDFVRNIRQLIDLLRQLAGSAPVRETRSAADSAADALFRGVVAASSLIGTSVDDDEPIGPDDMPEE